MTVESLPGWYFQSSTPSAPIWRVSRRWRRSIATKGRTRPEIVISWHVREEFSTFDWILERMLAEAGFTIEALDKSSPWYAAYTCSVSPP